MKITFVIDSLATANAGTENQLIKLLHGLSGTFDVELVCLRATPWLAANSGQLPVQVTVIELTRLLHWNFPTSLYRLTQHFRQTRPDVVHTFFPVANIWAVLCAHWAAVPAIVASRRDYGHWMSPRYLRATRFANRYVTRIVTNADQVRDLTTRVEGFPAERIDVIYNSIEPDRFGQIEPDDALRTAIGIPPGPKVITLVGNIRPIKRHDTLIDAARLLLGEKRDVALLFVGNDNGNRGEVVARVIEAGLQDRVFFAHAKGDIERYLAIADIGVNCSESEGLSNAIIEYMAAGLPTIVSRGGGNVDLVKDGVHGLTFAVGDAVGLADAIRRMLDDPDLRAACVSRARERVQAEMSLAVGMQRFTALYRGLGEPPSAFGAKPRVPLGRRVRNTLSGLTYRVAGSAAILKPIQKRISGRGVTVFMYHELGEDRDDIDAWQVVRRSEFLRQIDYIRSNYRVLSLDEAIRCEAYRGGGDRPFAVITFDDGHRGTLDHLMPILASEDLPATLYVATGHILDGRPYWFDRIVNSLQSHAAMSIDLKRWGLGVFTIDAGRGAAKWSQIQALLSAVKVLPTEACDSVADFVESCVAGIAASRHALTPLSSSDLTAMSSQPLLTLGAHSHGHEVLSNLPLEVAAASVERSRQLLQAWTGRRVAHFAYPGGFENPSVQAMIEHLGFRTAMGTRAGVWSERSPLFDIPRVAVGRYDSLEKFKTMSILGLRELPRNLVNVPA